MNALERLRNIRWGSVVDSTIRAGVVLTLAAVATIGVQQQRLADCLAGYAEDSAKTTAVRAAAAEQDRMVADREQRATDDVFRAAANADRSALITALNAYLAERAAADAIRERNDAERAAHPVPASPALRCG